MAVTAEELIVKVVSDTASAEAGLKNVGNLLASLLSTATGAGGGLAEMGVKAEAAAARAAMLETKSAAAAMQAQNLGVRAEQAAAQAEIFANKAALGGADAEAMGLKAQAAAARAQDLGVRAYAAGGQAEYLGTKAAAAGVQADAMAASAEHAGGGLAALAGSIDLGTVAAAGMTAGVVALVAGLADAAVKAAEFQTQLSRAQANTTMTTQETQAMGQAILDMSAKSGAGLADLGAGYVHIVNLLGDAADATRVLDVAQQSAVSTGGNVADTAQALARVMKEFGIGTDGAAAAMDTLHTAAAAGDLTLTQFTENSGNALAQAALYKVPLDQVAAAYVTLTKHGMDAADANTQLADQFLRLTTVTPKVENELERVSKLTGVDLVGDFTSAGLASKGLTGIYADLADAEHKMGLSTEAANAENMLLGDSLRGGRGLMIDVAYQTNDYLPILGNLDDKTASATKRQDDFNRALETTGGQFAVLKASAGAAAVVLGGPLNDALGGVLAVLGQTAREAGTWNDLVGTLANAWVTDADIGKAFAAEVDHIRAVNSGATDAIKLDTAALYDWGQAASEAAGQVSSALSAADAAANIQNAADHNTANQAPMVEIGPTAAVLAARKQAEQQALADAKTYYADQAATAKDAATATRDAATVAAQTTLDNAKTEIAAEKTAYDDRAAQDIKDRQAQTASALSELAKQNTAAQASAAAAHTADLAHAASIQHTADESDTAWKAQVTAIKDAATAGENALHTSNDKILTDAKARDEATYASQQATIAGLIHSREEADARDIHSHEIATAANIAGIEREKTAALSAIDQETRAYAAQEAERVKQIDATLSASVKALNDQLQAEQRANTERLAVNAMTKASGGAAGTELGQFFTASDAALADTEAAIAAKQAGNQKLADADTAKATQETAAAQALSDQLSAINQATADQMVTYKLQADSAITADQVAALTAQATAQKQALADQLATEKQSQADKKTAATSYYDGLKTDQQQQLADYKWTMAQNLQAFKDTEAQQLATDKTTLDGLLANIATQQAAENTRHTDALAKITTQAAADTAAIDALALKRKDDYTAQTAARQLKYAEESAARAADYVDAQQKLTKNSQDDIAAMQLAQKQADTSFGARTTAADNHFKDQQKQITDTYKADTDAIAAAQKANSDALTQMGKDTTAYAIQANSDLQSVIGNVTALTGAMGAAAGYHAPGKGPLGGAPTRVYTAADFQGAGQAAVSAYTGVYGSDAAGKWAQDATANAAQGKGAGNIDALLGSDDVVAKSSYFLSTAEKYQFGSGANTKCEAFVAEMEGRPIMDTAYVAAQHRIAAGQMRFDMPPPAGAEVFYGPNAGNEYDGHVAIALGNGMQRGVTSFGIEDDSTANWAANVAPFLGWVPAHTPMYDQGGVVPGAYGQPSLAIVHGGEEYLGLAGQRGTLASRTGGAPVVNIYLSGNTLLGRDPQVAQELWRIIEPAMRQQSAYANR